MRKLFLLLFAAACIQSCVPNSAPDTEQVIVHLGSDPDGLHPTNNSSGNRSFIFQYTQKTLIRMDLENLEYIPDLAETLPIPDPTGTRYTYKLRPNITWDDGSPITTDDVIFSTKIVCATQTNNPSVRANYNSVIQGIEKINPKEFVLITKARQRGDAEIFANIYIQPEAHWDPNKILRNYSIAQLQSDSLPRDSSHLKWFETFNDPVNANNPDKFVGAGPYSVTAWAKDQFIRLERKPNHFTQNSKLNFEQAYPKSIIFKIIPDDAAAKLALKNQEVDVSTWLGTKDLLDLQSDTAFTNHYYSDFVDQFTYTYYAMNTKPKAGLSQVFQDTAVRRAMAHLTPVDEIIETFLSGKAIRQITNVSSLKPSFNQNLKPISFDPKKAKDLLAKAGYSDMDGDGFLEKKGDNEIQDLAFTFTYINSPDMKEISLLIQSYMQEAGVNMKIEGVEFNTFIQKVLTRNFEAAMGAWGGSASYANPTQLWGTESFENGGLNFSGFGNAHTDSLIQACNLALEEDEFLEAYHAFQEEVYNAQPYVFLYSVKRKIVIHKRYDNANMYSEKPGVMVNNLKIRPGYGPGKVFEPTE